MVKVRYSSDGLCGFAKTLFLKSGLTNEQAGIVAEILVEADLMGHTTHGLQLLAPYLKEIEAGGMASAGEPAVLAEHPAALTWDGNYLPGPWLVVKAMEAVFARLREHPAVTVVIRRASHIGCLAAYLKRATDRGYLMLLTCSDPSVASVAPYGGHTGCYTPNPIAAGFPTGGDPVLIDISASTTTNGMVTRLNRLGGQRLPGPWLVDNQGNATDDPAVFLDQPSGAILPLGGTDLGYKGFALGLLVEALTSGLGGHGRAAGEKRWGASVFLQIINPAAFGGSDHFVEETAWLAQACRAAPVKPGSPAVRMPGARALVQRAEQLENGVALHPEILPALAFWADRLGVPMPGQMPA